MIHEDSLPAMRASMQRELNNPKVQGLLVNYTNFYGSYWTEVYSFGWYYEEVRIIRRDPKIRAWGGAQGFRTTDGQKLRVKNSGGRYFHYSCALRPDVALKKHSNLFTEDVFELFDARLSVSRKTSPGGTGHALAAVNR